MFIFVGGLTVHGVPDIEENQPSPRVVTYATFWPPGTTQGRRRVKKQGAGIGNGSKTAVAMDHWGHAHGGPNDAS